MVGAAENKSNFKEEQELREEITEGEASQNSGSSSSSSSSFLPELNLLFVLLSSISPNSNEDSNGENGDQIMRGKELEAGTTCNCNIARSSVKKKNVILEARCNKRVAQKFHTTIKDHRHGRKM